jgi:hypothetical protein
LKKFMKNSEKTLIIGAVIAVVLVAVVVYYGAGMTGNSMSDTSTPSYVAAKFTCANGAGSDALSKNCRPEQYWRNYANKFCRDLCEMDLDLSVDNADNADPSCNVASFNIMGRCSGAPPRPASCFTGCTGKTCGDDGCGMSCGTCSGSDVCIEGTCQTPQCDPIANCVGKSCGDDGCGGVCGTCAPSQMCSYGVCQNIYTDHCGFAGDSCPNQAGFPCCAPGELGNIYLLDCNAGICTPNTGIITTLPPTTIPPMPTTIPFTG